MGTACCLHLSIVLLTGGFSSGDVNTIGRKQKGSDTDTLTTFNPAEVDNSSFVMSSLESVFSPDERGRPLLRDSSWLSSSMGQNA